MKENENQAIEEMANVLQVGVCIVESIAECRKMDDCSICKATRLYNAGYRKQSEGEWIAKATMTRTPSAINYTCSVCGCESARTTPYCPNCGAHMNGD